ncbi:unnamed protein product [Chrysoparadoxa australica]
MDGRYPVRPENTWGYGQHGQQAQNPTYNSGGGTTSWGGQPTFAYAPGFQMPVQEPELLDNVARDVSSSADPKEMEMQVLRLYRHDPRFLFLHEGNEFNFEYKERVVQYSQKALEGRAAAGERRSNYREHQTHVAPDRPSISWPHSATGEDAESCDISLVHAVSDAFVAFSSVYCCCAAPAKMKRCHLRLLRASLPFLSRHLCCLGYCTQAADAGRATAPSPADNMPAAAMGLTPAQVEAPDKVVPAMGTGSAAVRTAVKAATPMPAFTSPPPPPPLLGAVNPPASTVPAPLINTADTAVADGEPSTRLKPGQFPAAFEWILSNPKNKGMKKKKAQLLDFMCRVRQANAATTKRTTNAILNDVWPLFNHPNHKTANLSMYKEETRSNQDKTLHCVCVMYNSTPRTPCVSHNMAFAKEAAAGTFLLELLPEIDVGLWRLFKLKGPWPTPAERKRLAKEWNQLGDTEGASGFTGKRKAEAAKLTDRSPAETRAAMPKAAPASFPQPSLPRTSVSVIHTSSDQDGTAQEQIKQLEKERDHFKEKATELATRCELLELELARLSTSAKLLGKGGKDLPQEDDVQGMRGLMAREGPAATIDLPWQPHLIP